MSSSNEVKFDPPNGAWVRLNIIDGDNFQAGFGLGTEAGWRNVGIVMVGIFTLPGTGDLFSRQLGESIATILRKRVIGGVVFTGSRYEPLGRREADGRASDTAPWFAANVTTPFRVDHRA